MLRWWTSEKRINIDLLFSPSCATKKLSNDVFGDVVAHDLDLHLKVKDSNLDNFDILNVVISQTVTNRSNITNANAGSHSLVSFE